MGLSLQPWVGVLQFKAKILPKSWEGPSSSPATLALPEFPVDMVSMSPGGGTEQGRDSVTGVSTQLRQLEMDPENKKQIHGQRPGHRPEGKSVRPGPRLQDPRKCLWKPV